MMRKDSAVCEAIDAVLRDYVPRHIPGASAVVSRGSFFFAKSCGFADLEKKTPAADSTKYMAASVTKQFACAAVLKLALRGEIEIDEKISKYFPELPAWADRVAVRNLMNHSSGIPDYFDEGFIEKYCAGGAFCRDDEALRIVSSYENLMFEPGTEHMYSNSGYILLGEIIAKVCGGKFSESARELLLDPAEMSGSDFLDSGERPEGMATGYFNNGGKNIQAPFNRAVAGWADGNLCCAASDLHKWHVALLEGIPMDKASYTEAASPLTLPDGRPTGAGFGLFSGLRGGIREVWHTGSTLGYHCRISRFTDLPDGENAAVIIMCNADSGMADGFGELFGKVTRAVLGDLLLSYEPEEGRVPTVEGRYISNLDEKMFCDVSPGDSGINLRGSIRGFKKGAGASRIKSQDDICFLVNGHSGVKVIFDGDKLIVDDVGRRTYLTRERR